MVEKMFNVTLSMGEKNWKIGIKEIGNYICDASLME